MKPVKLTKTKYEPFGNVLNLTNGVIELLITLDVGPRIISFKLCDKDNVFFEDVNDTFNRSSKDMAVFGDDCTWHIYGGHRLWSSPELSPRVYYPDNEPVAYKELKNGVRVIPPQQKWTNMQFSMDIIIKGDNKVEIKHKIQNKGAWDIELAPWALSVMKPGGLEAVPFSRKNPELLPNRYIGVWPYTNLQDKRITLGKRYLLLRQDTSARTRVKLGLNNEEGYAIYYNDGGAFVKSFETVEDGYYPDNGMSYETFTRDSFLEMESLGELVLLNPDETLEFTENWLLIDNIAEPENEKQIDEFVKKYLKK